MNRQGESIVSDSPMCAESPVFSPSCYCESSRAPFRVIQAQSFVLAEAVFLGSPLALPDFLGGGWNLQMVQKDGDLQGVYYEFTHNTSGRLKRIEEGEFFSLCDKTEMLVICGGFLSRYRPEDTSFVALKGGLC
jgi:hypothetical protein